MPGNPVGLALVPVIGELILVLLQQVVGREVDVRCGVAGVAQGDMVVVGSGRAGVDHVGRDGEVVQVEAGRTPGYLAYFEADGPRQTHRKGGRLQRAATGEHGGANFRPIVATAGLGLSPELPAAARIVARHGVLHGNQRGPAGQVEVHRQAPLLLDTHGLAAVLVVAGVGAEQGVVKRPVAGRKRYHAGGVRSLGAGLKRLGGRRLGQSQARAQGQ